MIKEVIATSFGQEYAKNDIKPGHGRTVHSIVDFAGWVRTLSFWPLYEWSKHLNIEFKFTEICFLLYDINYIICSMSITIPMYNHCIYT